MSDQHAEDLMALVTELSELEFRRGVLHARIEWHVRLRDLAGPAQAAAARPAIPARRSRGALQAAVLAALSTTPGLTCAQVAAAVKSGSVESVRQVLSTLTAHGRLSKQTGGRYVVAESHAGSGLVAVG